jgi:hypothetical protein
VSDARAWEDFCDALKRAGQQILRPEAPADDLTRAEGFRYLSRLLRGGLESALEFGDPRFPAFYSLSHETLKIGADNPDNFYQNARVDGRLTYRITGTRGTVHYLGFSTKAGGYGSTGALAPTGFLDSSTLRVEPDRTFAVTVSATRHEGNWLPMTEESTMLIVRQTFTDRKTERRAELTIERVGAAAERPAPLTQSVLGEKLDGAARFVEATARIFADWARDFAAASEPAPAPGPGDVPARRRRPEHPLLPRLLGARARRGARRARPAHPALRDVELPAQQLLDGVARLPLAARPT